MARQSSSMRWGHMAVGMFAAVICSVLLPAGLANAAQEPTVDTRCGGNLHLWDRPVLESASSAIHIATAYLTRLGAPMELPPLEAKLQNGVWYVDEILPEEVLLGGGVHIELCQSNGAVLEFYHGQ